MSSISREAVESAIRQYTEPYLGIDLITAGAVKNIAVGNGNVSVDVEQVGS